MEALHSPSDSIKIFGADLDEYGGLWARLDFVWIRRLESDKSRYNLAIVVAENSGYSGEKLAESEQRWMLLRKRLWIHKVKASTC